METVIQLTNLKKLMEMLRQLIWIILLCEKVKFMAF